MLRGEGLRAGIERFGEFANILFLKLISESEQIKRESGIPTKFDVACSWDSIKQIPISTRIEYINKTVYDKLNALYDTDIFTPLQIRDASILKEIMDKLDPLMLTDVDSDVKGDAFEYFLKASTSTKNDLGEYFTPRHIVKTMVRLVNPQIGEKIYDPFCGTGGFLIESFRYIHNNMARTEANMKTLRESTVYGNEITNTARITKMNMILAGDGHSNIKMLNTDMSHTYDQSINLPRTDFQNFSPGADGLIDGIDRNAVEEAVKKQIDYDCLMSYEDDSVVKMVEEIKDFMVDVLCGERTVISEGKRVSEETAKAAYRKITFEHVQYVLHSLVNYPDKISRIDRFLTTSLLNSVYTLMNSTFAGFEHDMGMKLL